MVQNLYQLLLRILINLIWCVDFIFPSLFVLLNNVLPTDLLPLVFMTLIIGYSDREHKHLSAETMFTIAITSIIPLSYYIGMGIAR